MEYFQTWCLCGDSDTVGRNELYPLLSYTVCATKPELFFVGFVKSVKSCQKEFEYLNSGNNTGFVSYLVTIAFVDSKRFLGPLNMQYLSSYVPSSFRGGSCI